MSEQREKEEQEVTEDEEENTDTNPQPGGSTAGQLPEDDGEADTDESRLNTGESRHR